MYGDPVLEQLTDYAIERAYAAPWSESATQIARPDPVLPGGKGGSYICFDPAHQYCNRITNTLRDVLDPQLKQQSLTKLYVNSNSTAFTDIRDTLQRR